LNFYSVKKQSCGGFMIIDQKFFDLTVKNYLNFIKDDIEKMPPQRQQEILGVMNYMRKINLANISEKDWKVVLMATKLFDNTPYKNDIMAIFKYVNEKFLKS